MVTKLLAQCRTNDAAIDGMIKESAVQVAEETGVLQHAYEYGVHNHHLHAKPVSPCGCDTISPALLLLHKPYPRLSRAQVLKLALPLVR